MRLADGAKINNVARLEKAEEIEKASEAAEEEMKNLPQEKLAEISEAETEVPETEENTEE